VEDAGKVEFSDGEMMWLAGAKLVKGDMVSSLLLEVFIRAMAASYLDWSNNILIRAFIGKVERHTASWKAFAALNEIV
jgi:hypothetical protein